MLKKKYAKELKGNENCPHCGAQLIKIEPAEDFNGKSYKQKFACNKCGIDGFFVFEYKLKSAKYKIEKGKNNMTFKEALDAKEENIYAEYQMRAARIVNWLLENDEITEEESEELYQLLWSEISESDDEFDQLVYEYIDQIREEE
jgi:predicted RNA-binding Zn-ribbon protein involved in translation (DUF1610 family)